MRLDDPRLAELARGDRGPVGGRLVRRGVGRPPAVHRRGAARGRRDPARPPQALPADLRPVRRAPLLRAPATCCGPCRRASASGVGIARVRGLLAPARAPAARPRRRADPDQRLVVAGPRPGRDERGRPRDGDLVADADADVRPADDVVRGLLQPGRGRRVDHVLGRLGGHRADRRGALQRAAVRRGPVHGRHRTWPTSGASGSRCRCCATSGRSSRSASSSRIIAERAGLARDATSEPGCRAGPRRRARASRRRARSASGATRRRRGRDERVDAGRSSCRPSWRSTPTSRGGSSASSSAASCARPASSGPSSGCRAASTRRSSRTSSPRRSAPSGCCAC